MFIKAWVEMQGGADKRKFLTTQLPEIRFSEMFLPYFQEASRLIKIIDQSP